MNETPVNKANPLAYAKAIVALVGAIATALLVQYGPDTEIGAVLTVVSIIATAILTYLTSNAPIVGEDPPAGYGDDDDGLDPPRPY